MLTHQVWGVVSSNFLSLIDNLGLGSSTQSPLQGLNILSNLVYHLKRNLMHTICDTMWPDFTEVPIVCIHIEQDTTNNFLNLLISFPQHFLCSLFTHFVR